MDRRDAGDAEETGYRLSGIQDPFGVRRQAVTSAPTGTQGARCHRNTNDMAQTRRRFGFGPAKNQSAVAVL